uniref:Uncharacterized protein n=1 Tax=viral metagenome TaxID=1070528 RepID=A0A6C0I329_9ZZZZ
METTRRECCVLCENAKLCSISQITLPVYDCVKQGEENIEFNTEIGYCERCYSVQLMNLADPAKLYDKNYFQPLHQTYLWIQHNINFIKFIVDNLNSDKRPSVIEIGSSSFCLGKHLIHYYKDFTVFDYSIEQANKRDDVTYIEGNCETYEFKENSNIIMSHVFEHLYEPKKFISNCMKNKVKNLFIAIPDMSNKNALHISNQHTFMYSDSDIEYLFGQYQYKLNAKVQYNTCDESFPCLFLHFTYTDNPIDVDRQIVCDRHQFMVDLLNKRITIPPNTFIATAGFFSPFLYFNISNKENVIGVIDYNKDKHNMKFSITDLLIQPYEHLKQFGPETSIVIMHPKKINIANMVRETNDKINIIIL